MKTSSIDKSINFFEAFENYSDADLRERIKELNCIYGISKLCEDINISFTEFFKRVTEIIPPGFKHPESTYVRVEFAGNEIFSEPFIRTNNFISENLKVTNQNSTCAIEVFIDDQYSFLNEENTLLQGIAQSIRNFIRSKIALEESLQNESRLKQVLNSQKSYLVQTDLEGNHAYWNKKFEEDFGWIYGESGIANGNALNSICEYHHERTLKTVEKCLASPGTVFTVDLDKPGLNNKVISTSWEFVCLTNPKGDPSVIHCMGIDITERVQTSRELEFSELRFRRATEINQSVIWETDLDGKFTYISPLSKTLYGYDPVELINKKYIYELYHLNESKRIRDIIKYTLDKKNYIFKKEFEARRKSGESIWVSSTLSPIFYGGHIVGYHGSDIDISKQKQTEESLNQFKVITDNAHYGLAIANLDGKLTYVNEKMANLHGYSSDELVGRFLSIFHNEDQLDKVSETLTALYDHGGFSSEEVDHVHKNGKIFPTLMSGAMIYDTENNPKLISATAIDITQSKKQKEEINKQNARLKAILDAIPDMVFITDAQGNYIEYYNSNKTDDSLNSKAKSANNISDIFEEKCTLLHSQKINECLNKNKSVTYEYKLKDDVGLQSYEATLVKVNEEHVLHFVRNISEQKRFISEIERLSIAIQQSPVAMLVTDPSGIIEYTSPAFYDIYGYTNDEIVGQHSRILKSGNTSSEVYSDLWSTISNGEVWFGEWQNKKKSGELFWERISVTPVINDNGKIENYLAIKEDITERKSNEEKILELNENLEMKVHERTLELEKTREEAIEANKAKSEFLSRMSHELRTPMNSILGFTQLLEMGLKDEKQSKWIKNILKSGQHLLNLINEVLDIARIEAGRVSISIEPVDCVLSINEIIDSISPLASQYEVHLEHVQTGNEKIFVKADKQRLHQVMLNLVNNAIKYNKKGGTVYISASLIEYEHENRIRIEITDTGKGISAKDQAKIFNPFERIGAEKTHTEGTGLGLAVVQKLVHLMNGEIGVDSTLGEGSTFWIELYQCTSQLENLQNELTLKKTHNNDNRNEGVILYIEDNTSNIELIEQILSSSRENLRLITNFYGKQAVKLARDYSPDLILMDMNLPDIHGTEVLEELKNNPELKHIPVIVISADAMPKQISKALDLGAEKYLTKPIEINEFLTSVDKFIK